MMLGFWTGAWARAACEPAHRGAVSAAAQAYFLILCPIEAVIALPFVLIFGIVTGPRYEKPGKRRHFSGVCNRHGVVIVPGWQGKKFGLRGVALDRYDRVPV